MKKSFCSAKKTAQLGVLLALACALSYLESVMLPPLPAGVRLGLSNLCVMLTLWLLGSAEGLTLATLKSVFVLLTRGFTAFSMSLCGGLASAVLMALMIKRFKPSAIALSVAGGVTHNLFQLLMASVFTQSFSTLWYLPILTLAGIASGILTGIVFGLVVKALNSVK